MGRATLDQNIRPTLIAVDSGVFLTPIELAADSTTHELLTKTSGTVSITGTVNVDDVVANSFCPDIYDNIALSYTGSNLTGVVFKDGVTTISTLTLAYNGSGNLTTVTKT